MKRRQLLGGAASLALAGCSSTRHGTADDTITPDPDDTPTPTATDADIRQKRRTPSPDRDDLVVDGVAVPVTVTIERENTGTAVYRRTFEEPTVVEALALGGTNMGDHVVTARRSDGTSDKTSVYIEHHGRLDPQEQISVEANPDGTIDVETVQS